MKKSSTAKKRYLALAQTKAELAWIYQKVEHNPNDEFYILRLGDAVLEQNLPKNFSGLSVKFLYLHDLEIDNEKVWQIFEQFKSELRIHSGKHLGEQLHLVAQYDVASSFLNFIYAQTTVVAVLNFVLPKEVLIPPLTISQQTSHLCIRQLQAIFYEEARGRKIKCRIDSSSLFRFYSEPFVARMKQFVVMMYLQIFDIKRRVKKRFKKRADINKFKNSVLILNANQDLTRQFDLKRFVKETERKSLFWNQATNEIQFLENFLAGDKKNKLDVAEIASNSFSISSFALAKNYFRKSFCLNFDDDRIKEVTNKRAFVSEKFHNWRRVAYAARLAAVAHDILRALQPAVVVASDTIDTNRAVSLTARSSGIKVLATTHGINLCKEPVATMDALGDVHLVFSQKYGSPIGPDMPGVKSNRIVAHDNWMRVTKANDNPKKRWRIFILTSPFTSSNFANWTNEIFVVWSNYIQSLSEIIQRLATHEKEIEIIIKSHPLFDCHEAYDNLRTDFPDLVTRHWREPLDSSEPIPADLVVLYNTVSTLTLAVIEQNLPVLGFGAALTPLARRKLALDQLHGTDDISQLIRMIFEVVKSPNGETANKAREKAEKLFNHFVEPTNVGLAEMVEFTLNL